MQSCPSKGDVKLLWVATLLMSMIWILLCRKKMFQRCRPEECLEAYEAFPARQPGGAEEVPEWRAGGAAGKIHSPGFDRDYYWEAFSLQNL